MLVAVEGLVDEGVTLLLTTQYLEEADQLADDIAVIDHGKVIARGTSDQLKTQIGGERLELVVAESDLSAAKVIADRIGATNSTIDPGLRKITTPVTTGGAALIELLRELDNQDIRPLDIALKRPSLDDVFLSLTGHVAEEEKIDGTLNDGKKSKKGGRK